MSRASSCLADADANGARDEFRKLYFSTYQARFWVVPFWHRVKKYPAQSDCQLFYLVVSLPYLADVSYVLPKLLHLCRREMIKIGTGILCGVSGLATVTTFTNSSHVSLRYDTRVTARPEPRKPSGGPRDIFENFKGVVGAGDEIRTHDFNLGKVALYP
jgi:hypothetical protein